LDRQGLAIKKADFFHTLQERGHKGRIRAGRRAAEEPDHRHCGLLRACRERPRGRRGAEQRYELAPLHSITSLARAANAFDTETPRRKAALRLIAMWNR